MDGVTGIDLEQWQARVQNGHASIARVYGAAELQTALADGPPKGKLSVFVVLLGESAEANRLATGSHAQQTAAQVGVLYALRNSRDNRGDAASDELQPIRNAVRQHLMGWVPADCYEATEFDGGQLFAYDNNVLWWADTYTSEFTLDKEVPHADA